MKRIFIPVFLLCIFLSCRKTLPDFIEIGNVKDVQIHSIRHLLHATMFHPDGFKIDINDDGINDLEYTVEYAYSPGGGVTAQHKISFLRSGISMAGVTSVDSIFARFDTAAFDFGPYHNVYFNTTYLFQRESVNDSVISADNVFKFKAFSIKDRLDASMEFKNEDFDLMNQYKRGAATLLYTKADTSYYNNLVNDKVKPYPYPVNKELYFGLKINGITKTRLGWLTVQIRGGGQAIIVASAIQ